MSKPTFTLTKKIPITFYRSAGTGGYVDGIWQEPSQSPVVLEVNIQPLGYQETMLLPEAERSRQAWKIYCADEIRSDQESKLLNSGWRGDEFEYQGYRYKVMKVYNYSMGILDHYKAIAQRIEITPN
tara:strand:+ start:27528 stop:27908 length:381 start_codon:yes stop_codon:yes gene_type:complete